MLNMYNFKNQLVNLINSSNLTIEQVYYILRDLFDDAARQYNFEIQKSLEKQQKKEIEKEEKEEEKTDGENQEN